jgi:small basic protein
MKSTNKDQGKNFLVKVTSFSLEVLLYAIIFRIFEGASLEQSMKAAIVLAIGVRLFIAYISTNKN